jgi:hypothetical protein
MRMRVRVAVQLLVALASAAASAAFAEERGVGVTPAAGASVPTGDPWLLVVGIDDYTHLPRL